ARARPRSAGRRSRRGRAPSDDPTSIDRASHPACPRARRRSILLLISGLTQPTIRRMLRGHCTVHEGGPGAAARRVRVPDQPANLRGDRVRTRPLLLVMRLVAFTAVAAVVLAGATAGASTHSAKPKKGGTYTFLFNTEPPGADPVQLREVPNISPA